MFTEATIDQLMEEARTMAAEWERIPDPKLHEQAARWRETVLRIIQYAQQCARGT